MTAIANNAGSHPHSGYAAAALESKPGGILIRRRPLHPRIPVVPVIPGRRCADRPYHRAKNRRSFGPPTAGSAGSPVPPVPPVPAVPAICFPRLMLLECLLLWWQARPAQMGNVLDADRPGPKRLTCLLVSRHREVGLQIQHLRRDRTCLILLADRYQARDQHPQVGREARCLVCTQPCPSDRIRKRPIRIMRPCEYPSETAQGAGPTAKAAVRNPPTSRPPRRDRHRRGSVRSE